MSESFQRMISEALQRPEATLYSDKGRAAWRIEREPRTARGGGGWLLRVPGVYPDALWFHFLVSVQSLEDVEGMPEADRLDPAAECEIMIAALRLEPLDGGGHRAVVMQPPEIILQYSGMGVLHDRVLCDLLAVAALRCDPPPAVDFMSAWHRSIKDWIEGAGGRIYLPKSRERNVAHAARPLS